MKMEATKCWFQNSGFCKFQVNCKFKHVEGVCQETNCRNKSCSRRHPRKCRYFFLRNYCRFGQDCRYDHNFDCEACPNLKFLLNKEMEKVDSVTAEKDAIIETLKRELSEAKSELAFVGESESRKVDELEKEKHNLKKENLKWKQSLSRVEKDLKFAKQAAVEASENEKGLNEKVREIIHENQILRSSVLVTERELKVTKTKLVKLYESYNCQKLQVDASKANLNNKVDIHDKVNEIKHKKEIKLKDEEISRLIVTRKICVENATKLQEKNRRLENEIKELKEKTNPSESEKHLPFPCDKCHLTFKTAGLLIKHVKTDHESLPRTRP